MKRILQALGLAVLMSITSVAGLNAQQPGDACIQSIETCWDRAAVAPYGNGSVERAIDLLVAQDVVADAGKRARIKQALLTKVRQGPEWVEPIPRNFRSTRMVFANGTVLPNVVAGTERWSAGQTRMADFYQHVESDGTVYLLFRPHICSNWSLRIITPQGVCIRDELLCAGECEKLRKQLR